jgi:hypothetical protein
MDVLGQLGTGQGLSDAVVADVGDLAQAIEQTKRLQHRGIDAYADAGVASFDPLQGRAGSKGALGHDSHGQFAAPPRVVDVGAELPQSTPYGC